MSGVDADTQKDTDQNNESVLKKDTDLKKQKEYPLWELPKLGDGVQAHGLNTGPNDREQARVRLLRDNAVKEGLAQGLAQAKEQASKEFQDKTNQLDALIQSCVLFEQFKEENLEKGILNLAIEIANRLVEREITVDTDLFENKIVQGLEHFVSSNSKIVITISDKDQELVASIINKPIYEKYSIKVIDDASLAQGSIHITNDETELTDTFLENINTICSNIFSELDNKKSADG